MREVIRKTHNPYRPVYHTETVILRLPALHFKTRHHYRQHENRKCETRRISKSVWVARKMCTLLQPAKRTTTQCTPPRRMPPLPQSPPMQPTQRITRSSLKFLCTSSLCYCRLEKALCAMAQYVYTLWLRAFQGKKQHQQILQGGWTVPSLKNKNKQKKKKHDAKVGK